MGAFDKWSLFYLPEIPFPEHVPRGTAVDLQLTMNQEGTAFILVAPHLAAHARHLGSSANFQSPGCTPAR